MIDLKIGIKIRDIRNSKKITLQSLSKLTNLTTSFLSQVERGIASPSIDSLRKITQALGMGMGQLFEEDLKAFTFIRKDKAAKVRDKETKSSYEVLVSDLLDIKMQSLVVRLQKDGRIKKELLLEQGDAFAIVMAGKIKLHLDKEKIGLNKGDSFYCKGQARPQRIANIGNKEAVLLWVRSK